MGKIPAMRADNSEIIPYNFEAYRVFVGTEKMSDHTNMRMFRHWHDDIELDIPLTGNMIYNINGEDISLEPGSGCFINTKQIHFGYSPDGQDCEFIYCLFHPMLLCATSDIEQRFVTPLLGSEALPYLKFNSSIIWHNDVMTIVKEIYNSINSRAPELIMQSDIFRIWSLIYSHAYRPGGSGNRPASYKLSTLRDMLTFIELNFQNKIYLDEIAAAGNVSKSCCNMIFNQYMKESPVLYLLNYRLAKSCELLIETDDSITDVAFAVGFTNLSYYISKFRAKYGCTPIQYRRAHKQ